MKSSSISQSSSSEPAEASKTHAPLVDAATAEASRDEVLSFVQRLPVLALLLDREYVCLAVSRRLLADLGFSGEDLVGLPFFDVFSREEGPWHEVFEEAMAGNISSGDEAVLQHNGGRRFWVSWHAHPWHYDREDAAGVLLYLEDETSRKDAEAELQRRDALVNLLQQVVLASNEAGTVEESLQFALAQVCAFTHWPVGHAYVRDADDPDRLVSADVWHFADERRFEDLRVRTRATSFRRGEGLPGRVWEARQATWIEDIDADGDFLRTNGASLGVHATFGFPVMVEGAVWAVLEFFGTEPEVPEEALLDVMGQVGTQLGQVIERKAAETALRRSEEQLARAQALAHLGSWEWDVRTGALTWSDQLYRIYGVDPEGGIDYERYTAIIHPEDRERTRRIVEQSLRTHEPFSFYHRIVRPDGEERILHARGEVEVDDQGDVLRLYGTGHDVTEARRAEEALRERERVLNRAQEIANLGSWQWNTATGALAWSDQLYRIYGLEIGAPVSYERYLAFVHPEDRPLVSAAIAQVLETGESFRFEERIVRDDGEERILSSAGEVIAGDDGVVRLVGVCHDITEQVRLQQDLDNFFTLSIDLLCVLDREGNFRRVNPAFARTLGYEQEALASMPVAAFVHPDDQARSLAEGERLARGEPTVNFVNRYRCKDGTYRWLSWTAQPTEAGPIYAVARDITEQREAEQALRESEQRFRLLAENMTDLVCLHDQTGCYSYVSPSAERILGYTAYELVGRQPLDLLHPDDAALARGAFIPSDLEDDADVKVLSRVRAKAGHYVWLETTSRLIHDGNEHADRLLTCSRNVTERVQAEREADRSRAALENRNRELQDFAYVASHDLQEPLRKIRAFTDLLREDYRQALGEGGGHYLERIQDASARMSQLINDLLTFSRVTTKGQPFQRVDLDEVLAGVLSDLEITISESGGEVHAEPLVTLEADSLQMRQLLQNLIGNALKFSRPGVAPAVRVWAEEDWSGEGGERRRVCRLTVEDDGIGFDEKYLDRIFTPFQRLHSREAYAGTGMGLAICRRIVERHHGKIEAHSAEGEGTTFIITLPLQQERAQDEEKDV